MKFILFYTTMFLSSAFGMAGTTKLDANSVELSNALVKPEIRECIDSTLSANKVFADSFSIKEIETYTAIEPLFLNSTTEQEVVYFIVQARASAKTDDGSSRRIRLKFEIAVKSGTGVLSYSCSAQLQ